MSVKRGSKPRGELFKGEIFKKYGMFCCVTLQVLRARAHTHTPGILCCLCG